MKCACAKFWNDERGFLISSEILLVSTILVIGLVVGLDAVRDSVVTELADVGQAIANLNQSFSFGGVAGHCAITSGSVFIDTLDFCDSAWGNMPIANSKCVVICLGVGTFPGEAGFGAAGFGGNGFGAGGWGGGAVVSGGFSTGCAGVAVGTGS